MLSYDQGNNGMGRLAGVNSSMVSYSYAYDAFGNLITEQKNMSDKSYQIHYDYDMSGRLKEIAYPDGLVVTYTRNNSGDISSINLIQNGVVRNIISDIEYMPFGPVRHMVFGNGLETSVTFDQSYHAARISTGDIQDISVSRNPKGFVNGITNHLDLSNNQSFEYDYFGRLARAQGAYGDISYTYDLTGNRILKVDSIGAYTYSYGAGTSRLTEIIGPTNEMLGYDSNGSTNRKADKIFLYNSENRLRQVFWGNNWSIALYTYDIWGKRLSKGSIHYHYDLEGNLIAETDGAGNLLRAYIRLHGEPVAMIAGNGSIYYYHNDHLGTPSKMTDANGDVVWAADYLPFGRATVTVDTIENNLRFPGQYYDIETGLHYNWNRYYDPDIGRYLTPDPIGFAGRGVNLYAYTDNNPINRIDPSGLDWIFQQSTGQMYYQPPASAGGGPPALVATGYSGNGTGLNNPAMQNVPNVGPIPQGTYTIEPQQNNVTSSGTTLIASERLIPDPGNQMYGRAGFLIHGDNSAGNQSASSGCPVFNKSTRDRIGNSGDNVIRVVP